MIKKIIVLNLLFTLLLSCKIDPQYSLKKPIDIPQDWQTQDEYYQNQHKKQRLSCMPWWKQFHDPTLNRLVALALKRNQKIQSAIGNVDAARGELKRVELDWVPSVDSMLGYSSFPYLGYPGVLAVAGPSYVLNIFNQIKEQARAHALLRISKARRDSIRLMVIAEMTRSYFSYLASIEQLALINRIEHDLQELVEINQSTYQGGLTSDIELTKARSALHLIRAKKTIINNNILHSAYAIHYLLNENPCPFKTKRHFYQIEGNHVIIGSIPVNVIENRPDMIEAIEGVRVSNAEIGMALSHFLPTLQLNAVRGDIATIPNGKTLGMPVYFNEALIKQPVITLSSFGRLDEARGLNKAAYYHYVDTLRQALRDINNDLSSHEQLTQRLQETRTAYNDVKAVYQLNQSKYQQGILSYQALLKPKIEYDQIAVILNQRKREQLMSIIQLYQDLALGYRFQESKTEH